MKRGLRGLAGRGLFMLCICAASAGCGHRPTGYQSDEEAVSTRGGFGGLLENGLFHDVLYSPESIALNFPGYIVGIDKSPQEEVNAIKGEDFPTTDGSKDDGLEGVKQRMNTSPKIQYVSHIVRYGGKPFGDGNCVLHTTYMNWGQADGGEKAGGATDSPCNPAAPSVGRPAWAFADSRAALETFRQELRRVKGDGYTHVLLVSMGWNTPQTEAVRNFNAIASQIQRAANDAPFKPLFVGVTWPSVWSAKWLEPAVKVFSYRTKAHDADEVGTIWVSVIADILREEAPANARLIAIGHSFGARVLFSALCNDDVWRGNRRGEDPASRRIWDVAIGWQPAFSINRFKKDGSNDGFAYPKSCTDRVETIVLTSSDHDKAVGLSFWSDTIGSHEVWAGVCPPDAAAAQIPLFNCIRSEAIDAASAPTLRLKRGWVNYLDASSIVFFNHPNTSGGAHSDIFRRVHGQLNWNAMNLMN